MSSDTQNTTISPPWREKTSQDIEMKECEEDIDGES
jgi:hypothetical protein